MVKRRRAVPAILGALLFAAARASALGPTISGEVSQCDGSYALGSYTHAPASQVHVQAAVQTTGPGLRMTPARTRMGTGNLGLTNALWRFDSSVANVTVSDLGCNADSSGLCPTGFCHVFGYTYNDEDQSDPMDIGNCIYDSDCAGTDTLVGGRTPLGGACPGGAPGTGATPFFPADGHFYNAGNARADFDGASQFGSVTYAAGYWDMPNTYTLSAWIYVPAGGTGLRRIISEQGPAGYWGLSLGGNGQVRSFDSREAANVRDIVAGPSLNNSTWHKIDVVRVNGQYKRYYVDGVWVASFTAISTTSFTTNPIRHPIMIGRYEEGPPGGEEYFLGSIDEIRVMYQALTDDDILLEYQGSIHKYSSNGGASYTTATGGYVIGTATYPPTVGDGYHGAATYIPGEAYTGASQQWIFMTQDTTTVSTVMTAPYSVSLDTRKPLAGGLAATPTSTSQIRWDWTSPGRVCVYPGTGQLSPGYVVGPYAQLFDCASGAATTNPGLILETARTTNETYAGGVTPNQFACRSLAITDIWGTSPLTSPASAYTLAAAPTGLSISAVSSGSFVASWSGNGNPSYTRFEVGYSQDPLFGVAVTTRVALTDGFTATSVGSSGLANGATYYVRVRAFNGRASDGYGGTGSAYLTGHFSTVPPAPTLTGTPNSNSQITWTWTTAPGAVSYALYDTPSQTVLYGPAAVLSYPQFGLSPNTRYDAEVEAELAPPTPASPRGHAFAYTFANLPTAPVVSSIFVSSAALTWGPNGNPAYTFYQLLYSTDSTFAVGVTALSVAATTATATALLPGATYFAKVQAISGGQQATSFTASLKFATALDPKITISSSPASPYVPASGLAGAWQFDEGAGTTTADGSGLGNSAALTCVTALCVSTPTFTAGPQGLGNAALMSGLQGAVITQSAPSIGAGSLTIEAWVNPQTLSQPPGATIASIGPSGSEEFALDLAAPGTFRFFTTHLAAAQYVNVATVTVVPGQWTHIVGVYDQTHSTSTLYLNGKPVAVRTGVQSRPGLANPLWIGNRQGGTNMGFAGTIDAVRIFGKALTPAEVYADYAGSFVSTVAAPSPNSGVLVGLPPNAFASPAAIYVSRDPAGHPIRVSGTALNAGLATLPAGLTMVPNSLVEVVPVVNGSPYTLPLGSSATLSIPFTDANHDNLIDGTNPPLAASAVQMYTLNTTVNRWESLPTSVDSFSNRATGVTPHFSVFALFAPTTIGAGLSSVKAYPVPWKPGSAGRFDATGVTFANLPAVGTIRILTLSGQKVRDISFDGAGAGFAVWDGNNDDGRRAASGVYFARVKNAADNSTVLLKIAVER